jgi:hypothetical protein
MRDSNKEWICCKKNLVKIIKGVDYSKVVLITDGIDISIGRLVLFEQYQELRWFDLIDNLRTNNKGWPLVTHWMKLPKLPKILNRAKYMKSMMSYEYEYKKKI